MAHDADSRPLGRRLAAVIADYTDAGGNVDYSAVEMANNVREYVESLPAFDLSVLRTREEKIAFWINAYNMISIYGVLETIGRDPGFANSGNRGLLKRVKFFFTRKYDVGGERLSLNAIEKKLRFEFGEARTHFALVCGAASCPPLKGGLYSADDLDRELDLAARVFINSPKGVELDKPAGTIRLSRIFKWFRADFGPDERAVLDFVARFHTEGDYIKKEAARLKIEYMRYDWGLNRAGRSEAV